VKTTLYVALVSAYPTEADARPAIDEMPDGTPYLGTWRAPWPDAALVHMFSHASAEQLERAGWAREDA
jgi:hypothetical protein